MASIVRVIARHPQQGEHVIYALAGRDVDVDLLRARGYDVAVEQLDLEPDDPRVGDAITVSFFAIVSRGWKTVSR